LDEVVGQSVGENALLAGMFAYFRIPTGGTLSANQRLLSST